MSAARIHEILEALESSRSALAATLQGVSEAQAIEKPEEGRWSVRDCAEHLALVEERFIHRLETALRADAPQVDLDKEASLATKMANRTERRQAPDPVQPTGRFATLAEAYERFHASRTRMMQFAEQNAGELSVLQVQHPAFGLLSGAEQVLLTAFHTRRHTDQIREVLRAITSR